MMPRFKRINDNKIFRVDTPAYIRFPLDICSGYSQLLQLSSFISETVYLLTGSLESSYYSTSSVGILAIHCVNPQNFHLEPSVQ
jgi:hypothetical protein